ncbi:benzaldehyde dehydrogenase [Rathayibacter soli]|uniref:benzaldehyde dehydrogenase n=1 Tax=Rathayibacter soli TaxID=3144168 RepID=UPI0027E4363E|nr:benzaldehyde dehydrogenase [Glaciibacter superstes]
MTFFEPSEWDGRLYSSGWTASKGGSRDIVEPATESSIGRFGVANTEDVSTAVAVASEAQKSWAATSYEERAAVLRRAGDLMETHNDVLSDWLIREAGSPKGKAAFETHMVSGLFYAASALALTPYGQLLRSAKPRLSLARRLPVGVVGVISPFNFPQILSMRSVAPALALGNAVILKPDPRTAVSGGLVFAAILEEAGLPSGLFHVLPGAIEPATALIEHPVVRVISFTGSTKAGRAIGELGARHLKRVHLELGGNNAMLVLDDVDVPQAVSAGAWGSFLHQGQVCMTTGRHLVHESIYDEYVERLSATASGLPVGNGATTDAALGPVIDAGQRDRIHSLVTGSVAAGARLTAGGTYEGLFYRPTVLADSAPDQPAFEQEVFGPVAPVMKFSSLDEAVDIVNQSEYGLSLAILTKDALRGLALSDRMHSGIVHINDQTVDDEPVIPFGGVGASGTGSRFGGADANIEAFTDTQWVTMQTDIERYPF